MNDDAHVVACASCSTVHSMLPSASADFFRYAPAEVTIAQQSKTAKLIAGEPHCSWLYDGPGAASSRTALQAQLRAVEMAGGGGGGGGGAGEHRGGGGVSYWYDTCEDNEDASLLCDIDFTSSADFDPCPGIEESCHACPGIMESIGKGAKDAESNGIADKDEVEKKERTQPPNYEELNFNETSEEMQPTPNEELAFHETSEQLQPAEDDELAQDDDTKGTKTIGERPAESNGIANTDEVEKTNSMQSTDSEVTDASFLFQLSPKLF
ncbi:hypothetical protein ZWY2020_037934 [Hordeum vulgare]|nr:hypothetical protein ZWY2020_037934 [Hordeum vulgare]